jgi:hypothetical protein
MTNDGARLLANPIVLISADAKNKKSRRIGLFDDGGD